MDRQLLLDRLNQAANVQLDQLAITKELIQIIKDKGDSAALGADRNQLFADPVQLQTDEINGLSTRINTRQTFAGTITTDLNNITSAAMALDPTGPLRGALTKFTTDRGAVLSAITTDLQSLVTSRTTLSNALSAQIT